MLPRGHRCPDLELLFVPEARFPAAGPDVVRGDVTRRLMVALAVVVVHSFGHTVPVRVREQLRLAAQHVDAGAVQYLYRPRVSWYTSARQEGPWPIVVGEELADISRRLSRDRGRPPRVWTQGPALSLAGKTRGGVDHHTGEQPAWSHPREGGQRGVLRPMRAAFHCRASRPVAQTLARPRREMARVACSGLSEADQR